MLMVPVYPKCPKCGLMTGPISIPKGATFEDRLCNECQRIQAFIPDIVAGVTAAVIQEIDKRPLRPTMWGDPQEGADLSSIPPPWVK